MRCAYQFICDRTNTVFNEWFLNYQEFSRKADEEKSFLKKRLEALNREADEQNRNQRTNIFFEKDGERLILKDWCKKLNINYDAVRHRLS